MKSMKSNEAFELDCDEALHQEILGAEEGPAVDLGPVADCNRTEQCPVLSATVQAVFGGRDDMYIPKAAGSLSPTRSESPTGSCMELKGRVLRTAKGKPSIGTRCRQTVPSKILPNFVHKCSVVSCGQVVRLGNTKFDEEMLALVTCIFCMGGEIHFQGRILCQSSSVLHEAVSDLEYYLLDIALDFKPCEVLWVESVTFLQVLSDVQRKGLLSAVQQSVKEHAKYVRYRWLPHQARMEALETVLFPKYFLPDAAGGFSTAFGRDIPHISSCQGEDHSIEVGAGTGAISLGGMIAGVIKSERLTCIELNADACNTMRTCSNWQFQGMDLEQQSTPTVLQCDANVVICRMAIDALRSGEVSCTPECMSKAHALPPEVISLIPSIDKVSDVSGGPNCQGFSMLNSSKDCDKSSCDRSAVLTFLSFVELCQPSFGVMENVMGMVIYDHGSLFRSVLACFAQLGYQVTFAFLNAACYGLGQSRGRLFIMYARLGYPLAHWPARTHTVRRKGHEVKPPVMFLNRLDSWWGGVHFTPPEQPSMCKNCSFLDFTWDLPANTSSTKYLKQAPKDVVNPQCALVLRKGAEATITHHVAGRLNEQWMKAVSLHSVQKGGVSKYRVPRHGLLGCVKTSPAVNGRGAGVVHHTALRTLSVREYMRGQGFPDTFTLSGCRSSCMRQIGNAVPPILAYKLFRQMKRATMKRARVHRKSDES